MNKTWIVTSETYLRQTKSWSFLLLVLMPFLFIGMTFGISYVATPNKDKSDIAVVSTNSALRTSFIKQSGVATTKKYATAAAAQKATNRSDINGYVVLKATGKQVSATFNGPNEINSGDQAKIQRFLATLQT